MALYKSIYLRTYLLTYLFTFVCLLWWSVYCDTTERGLVVIIGYHKIWTGEYENIVQFSRDFYKTIFIGKFPSREMGENCASRRLHNSPSFHSSVICKFWRSSMTRIHQHPRLDTDLFNVACPNLHGKSNNISHKSRDRSGKCLQESITGFPTSVTSDALLWNWPT